MELGRCPICHARISLDAMVKDQAGRELLALLAKLDNRTAQALVTYLGLFRSANRDLANDRALRLANEVLALEVPQFLAPALINSCERLLAKRDQGQIKPLTDHGYLKAVLASVREVNTLPAGTGGQSVSHSSSRATLDQLLNDNDW
jgi:hypothetical protein